MSGRVAYLERTARGSALVGARVVGERDDESTPVRDESPGSIAALAAWMKERLPKSHAGRPTLDVLCMDTDGSLCSWLSSPTDDAALVAALARQGGTDGWGGDENRGGVLSGYAATPQEAGVQPLSSGLAVAAPKRKLFRRGNTEALPSVRRRIGVLATPDVPVRVLLDELDALDVRVLSVCSLWHAIAAAWDPSGVVYAQATGNKPHAVDGVVSESSSVHASLVVDTRGRLHWSWADGGKLLAGGSIRVRTSFAQPGELGAVNLTKADVSRLATEWLAWSMQLGAAPSRVTCVVPSALGESPGSLTAAQFGASLGAAWPQTTVDLVTHGDPLGATLARLAAAATAAQDAGSSAATFVPSDPRLSLVQLANRPGKAHFRLHLWWALAIAVLSAGLGAWAWKLQLSASAATAASRKAAAQWRELFKDIKLPQPILPGTELIAMRSEIAKRERDAAPITTDDPSMPIVQEIETLGLVLSFEQIELTELTLDSRRLTRPRIVVIVPSLEVGEQLSTALKQVAGSNLTNWDTPQFQSQAGKIRATYVASWAQQAQKPIGERAAPAGEPGGGPA